MSMTEIRTIKLNFIKISNVQIVYNIHYRITKYFRVKKMLCLFLSIIKPANSEGCNLDSCRYLTFIIAFYLTFKYYYFIKLY